MLYYLSVKQKKSLQSKVGLSWELSGKSLRWNLGYYIKQKPKLNKKNPQKQVFVTFCMIKQNIWWELIISPKLEKVVEGRWFQLSNWMYFLNLMRLDFRSGPVISILLFIHISVFLSIVVAVARNNPFLFRIINHPFLEAKF